MRFLQDCGSVSFAGFFRIIYAYYMRDSIIHTLENELRLLTLSESSQLDRLAELDEFRGITLIPSLKSNGEYYYYAVDPKSGKRVYVGGENNEYVMKIKECRLLEESLQTIDKNKALLIPVIKQYSDFEIHRINENLPKTYRNANLLLFDESDPRALEWKEKKIKFKEDYLVRHPDKHPESLTFQRLNGDWMRSKSEGSIADILDMNKLTWVYELPHLCKDVWLKSDFTVLSPLDYTSEIIIEHAGRMDIPEYREKFIFSLRKYMEAGYKPNINLFFTFDNLDQTFSQIPVQNIIDNWLRRS